MGTMLSLKLETILEAAKGLKTKIASLYPETDDHICENYGILLAMAEEVSNNNYQTSCTGSLNTSVIELTHTVRQKAT